MDADRPKDAAGASARGRGAGRARRLRRLAVALVVLAGAASVTFHRPLFLGNLGAVEPGRVYRCAQPKGNLDRLIAAYRPGSILNLRGGSYTDAWYAAEVEAADRHGVDFYDFPMKATRRPTRAELLTLLDLLDRCRYPLVIHCKAGADRTGLVSGLYLLVHAGRSPDEALGAFSLAYGHVPIGGPERLHEPFEEYRDWLRAEGKAHDPARFRDWVARHYRDEPGAPGVPAEPLRPGSRMGPRSDWLARTGGGPKG